MYITKLKYLTMKNVHVGTVVPALGDPVVSGHLLCMDTLSMSRHISTLNYL